VQVGPADADGTHPDDDLVVTRLLELELAHLEGPSMTIKDGGASLHFGSFARCGTRPNLARFRLCEG
jgi:hypothetical protein